MSKTSLKSKSVSAFLWDFSGSLSNQVIAFSISIILARLLAPEEFGLIAMINVIFVFSNILLDVGLGSALIQRKHLLPIHYSSVFYFNVLIGIVLTVITYFSANWIAGFYKQTILIPLIQVMSITFLINAATVVQNAKLKRNLNFKHKSIVRILSNLMSGVIGIIMAFKGFGVWSLLTQQLLNKFIFTTSLWVTVGWLPQLSFSIKALKQLWNFGFKIFLTDFLSIIFTKIDILIIGKLFPLASLGFYQRAKSLDNMVIQFSSASMMQVLFPIFSSIQNEVGRLKKIVLKATHLMSFLLFFIIGIGYLCAEEFIIIVFTAKWLPAVEYFKILLLCGFVSPFSSLYVNIIVGRGNSTNHLKLSMLKKIPQGLNLAIGFLFGIKGFLYGSVISGIITFLMNIHYTKKELTVNYNWFLKPFYPPLLLSSALVISISYIFQFLPQFNNFIALIIKAGAFGISYIIISYILSFTSLNLIISEFKLILKKNPRATL